MRRKPRKLISGKVHLGFRGWGFLELVKGLGFKDKGCRNSSSDSNLAAALKKAWPAATIPRVEPGPKPQKVGKLIAQHTRI